MYAIDSNPSTSITLIRRLVDDASSEHAWPEFHRRYRRVLLRWCRGWGVSIHDVDDVIQDSLMAMFRHLPDFERRHEGAFRGWMKLITLRVWHSHLRREARSLVPERLKDVQNEGLFGPRPIRSHELLDLLDRIADVEILELALLHARRTVSGPVWELFESCELRRVPVEQVAACRGITLTAVRVSNFRVRKLLREFVARLESS